MPHLRKLACGNCKRGGLSLSDKMVWNILDIIFTVIVIGGTFYVMSAFIITKTNVSATEAKILESASYFSPEGFALSDAGTGRAYPGIISQKKFSDSQMKDLFSHNRPHIAGRFAIKASAISQFTKPMQEITAYTDRERYLKWQPIAQAGGKGIGGKTGQPAKGYAVMLDQNTGKLTGVDVESVFITPN